MVYLAPLASPKHFASKSGCRNFNRLYAWCQWIGMLGQGSRLSTYWYLKQSNKWWCSHHTSADQTPTPCVPWVKTKMEGVKSGSSGPHKPGKLGLSYKTNKCSDAGTGDLGVLPTHETSPIELATSLTVYCERTGGFHPFYSPSCVSEELFQLNTIKRRRYLVI